MSTTSTTSIALTKISHITRYSYGTTRLADQSIPFADRVKMARTAMDTGVWFHTSRDYGDAFHVLRAAFDEAPSHVPEMIFKIGGSTEQEMLSCIEESMQALNVDHLGLMQVCLGDPVGHEARTGGAVCETLQRLKNDGTIGGYVLEVWPWTSDTHLAALRANVTPGLFDAITFYFNPMQRFATNELFDLVIENRLRILALRTLGGGSPTRSGVGQVDVPVPWSRRVAEIVPIFEQSGIESWTEFCIRYVFPTVLTTIGATSRSESLSEMIAQAQSPTPLASEVQQAIEHCQRQWADLDKNARPWSM